MNEPAPAAVEVDSHGRAPRAPADPGARAEFGTPRIPAKKILVVRLGSLGDVVRTRFALPALRRLYPDAHIDWLVEDRCAAGLTGIADVDGILTVPRKQLELRNPLRFRRLLAHTVDELRQRQYDLAIDFHSITKSALLLRLAGIPVRVGYDRPLAREGAQRFFTERITLPRTHLSRFERNRGLVDALDADCSDPARWGDVSTDAPPSVRLDDEDETSLPPLPARFVVVHPGTSASTLYKRWEPERFARVARQLAELAGLPTVVTWGPVAGERECAQAVVSGAPRVALLAPQTRSLGALLALLGRSCLYIGSDSGPMHLASLMGRPSVALFGPTDPVENAPFGGVPWRMVREDVGCNPCREGCPARSCMAAIQPDRVVAAALELLGLES